MFEYLASQVSRVQQENKLSLTLCLFSFCWMSAEMGWKLCPSVLNHQLCTDINLFSVKNCIFYKGVNLKFSGQRSFRVLLFCSIIYNIYFKQLNLKLFSQCNILHLEKSLDYEISISYFKHMVLFLFLLQRYESMFTIAIPVNTDKFKEKKVVVSIFGNLEYLLKKCMCSRDYVLNIGRINFN